MSRYKLDSDGLIHAKKQSFEDDRPLRKISVKEQKEIDFCLTCTRKTCKGRCKDFTNYKKKLEKNKDIIRQCDTCEHCIFRGDIGTYWCSKHKGIVEPTDTCIEEGM